MRKFLLAFFLITNAAYAQKYQPFDTNMVWYSYTTTSPCYQTYRNHVQGYIINNNRMWHKVYATTTVNPCHSSVSQTVTNSFAGFFSNDTVGKKVYFVNSAALAPNFNPAASNVLFDFNATLGDYMQLYNPILNNKYKVVKIDSIFFGNKYHKLFNTVNTYTALLDYTPKVAYFIEGVGASFGTFNHFHNGLSGESNILKCFSLPGESKYFVGTRPLLLANNPTAVRDTSSCEVLLTNIKEPYFENKTLLIFPNPASNFLNVEYIEDPGSDLPEMRLIDILGKEVLNLKLQIHHSEVDLSELKPGIYFLQVIEKGKIIITRKVIKE